MNKKIIKTIDISSPVSKTWYELGVLGLITLWGISSALTPAFGVEPATKVLNKPSTCRITVVTVLKSEETYERSYPFDFKTEQECKKSAERHSTNFNPEMIEKVTSTYVWTKGK